MRTDEKFGGREEKKIALVPDNSLAQHWARDWRALKNCRDFYLVFKNLSQKKRNSANLPSRFLFPVFQWTRSGIMSVIGVTCITISPRRHARKGRLTA